MSQNRSTAVMQQRAPRDPATTPDELDYFPTPPWAARALGEFLLSLGIAIGDQHCWEPACGEGHMVRGLADYFGTVLPSDVFRYNQEHGIHDFADRSSLPYTTVADWIVTNPPFLLGEQFVERAIELAWRGVAMFVRSAFTESATRYEPLFAPDTRPSFELQFCERVVLLKDRLIRSGTPDPFNLDEATGKPRKASSATSYAWLIWLPGQHDTRKRWIPPGTRLRLERPGDYPDYSARFPEVKGPLL